MPCIELLINGVLFDNLQNVIIVSSNLAVHNQIIGKGRRNSCIAKHCDKFKQSIREIDTVGFIMKRQVEQGILIHLLLMT
jgi:hypothetical protein